MITTQKVVKIHPVGEITILRSRRSKKLRMTVKPDKQIVVSIPYYSGFSDAIKFAQNNTDWIIKQQKKIETVSQKFAIGSNIVTKFHTLSILNGQEEQKAVKNGSRVTVYIPSENGQAGQDFIRDILTRIYRMEAKQFLPERLSELARMHGFRFNRIAIRNNKRNWGSCSSKNNINLNLQLMKLPGELIDYVLLHELAHTVEKNHGPGFWALLDRVTGNQAKELAKKVKLYAPYL